MSSTLATDKKISIQVVYALPDSQYITTLSVHTSCTAQQAVETSGLLQQFPDIQLSKITLGIFGKIISHDTRLNDGDRLEIYRPLMIDPKESRRNRAQLAKNKN